MKCLTEKEMQEVIGLIKKAHINQLTAIFNYIINFAYKNKMDNEEYMKFLKAINRI